MTNCPVCNKPVDPLRARFVAVRAGKVVPYCSPECRDAQDTKPTKAPVVEAAPAPPAKPKTPPTGVPKAKTPPTGVPTKTPSAGVPKTKLESFESGPVIEILHEPASGVVTSAKDERTTQPTGKFAKEEVVEVKETKPRPDGSKGSAGKDSAALAGELTAKRARTRPSGKHLTKERTDSTEAKAGWDWLDDEPADEQYSRPGTLTESEKPVRWPFVVLLALVLVGGGGFYVWKYVLNKDKRPAVVPDKGTNAAAPMMMDAAVATEPDAFVITRQIALQKATELLRKHIAEGSPRVQRLAAGALGRTGDPAAVAALQQAVKQEKIPAARLKVAYELARANDKAGREALVQGLNERERSDKLDAATRLAMLGDDRAKPLLSSLLGVAQHKLGAARELSRLKDPAATQLLEQVRADARSSVDEKATATIALFRAGKTELLGDVKQLLENESWKAFAAYALAEAKDEAGKPLLVEQVTNGVGVRVRAALALRKLLGEVPDDLIVPLVDALGSQKDQEQIMAAEAILILGGDPQWSEYP